jgi:hypothetical protein
MARNELQEMLSIFSEGSGFGDPDARLNAEQRLQVLVAMEQQKIAKRLTG